MTKSLSRRGGVPALARGRERRRTRVGGVGRDPIPLTLQDLVHGRDAAVAARTAIPNRRGTSKANRLILELNRQLDVRLVLPGGGDDFLKRIFSLAEKRQIVP